MVQNLLSKINYLGRWKMLVIKNGLLPKKVEISGFSSSDLTTCESLNWISRAFSYLCVHICSAWIEEANLKPYFQFKDTLSKTSKATPFREAVQSIESYVENQRKGGGNVSWIMLHSMCYFFVLCVLSTLYNFVYITDWWKRIGCWV
jgi:hypothetical protein